MNLPDQHDLISACAFQHSDPTQPTQNTFCQFRATSTMFALFELIGTFINFFLSLFVATNKEPFLLNEDVLQQVRGAFNHSQFAFWDNIETRMSDIHVFDDGPDLALVRYLDHTCYVSFRGTTGTILDNLQSVPGLIPRQACGAAGCCFVERGIHQAYYSSFVSDLEAEVEACTQRCDEDGGCDVVLTGYSQGGTIASVAAIALAQYNPTLITYGQQPVAWFNCRVLDNMETYLRFTSLCPEGGEPHYDAVTYFGNPIVSRHSGTMVMLGNGAAATIGRNARQNFFPVSGACHDLEGEYQRSIDNLEIGPLDGFPAGSLCTASLECQSGTCRQSRCM